MKSTLWNIPELPGKGRVKAPIAALFLSREDGARQGSISIRNSISSGKPFSENLALASSSASFRSCAEAGCREVFPAAGN
jgi:hypothetical protein